MTNGWPLTRFYTREDGHCPASNFSPSWIFLGGAWWASVEHYYQAMKSTHPGVREEIRQAETPGIAKRMGRGITLRDDWEAVKIPVMRQGLSRKFTVDTSDGVWLLGTGDALLVEGNTWKDTFWGVDDELGGQNWLGHLLMARRAELRPTVAP